MKDICFLKEMTPIEKRKLWVSVFIAGFIFFVFITLLRMFIFEFMKVQGDSMNPTLISGDKRIVNKLSTYLDQPRYGDIVLFNVPQKGFLAVKRIIAVGGDTISIKGGKVFVNGHMIKEPYVFVDRELGPDLTDYSECVVPENHVFVLGDNRNHSLDSRSEVIGMVPQNNIEGYILN